MERIIVTRRESIVDFFVYAMKNTVLCIRYFSNTKHKSAKNKLDNVFQSNCSSHAELPTNLRKIEKRPKIRHKAVMHPALQLLVACEIKHNITTMLIRDQIMHQSIPAVPIPPPPPPLWADPGNSHFLKMNWQMPHRRGKKV